MKTQKSALKDFKDLCLSEGLCSAHADVEFKSFFTSARLKHLKHYPNSSKGIVSKNVWHGTSYILTLVEAIQGGNLTTAWLAESWGGHAKMLSERIVWGAIYCHIWFRVSIATSSCTGRIKSEQVCVSVAVREGAVL